MASLEIDCLVFFVKLLTSGNKLYKIFFKYYPIDMMKQLS